MPFRDAHEAVSRAVRQAETAGCDLSEMTLADLRHFAPLVDDDVYAVLTLDGSVASRNHPGGTAPLQVRAAAQAARAALDPAPSGPGTADAAA
jgi:argininosuccinate lyase